MWDLETIKHLNKSLEKNNPKLMSKLWRYMDAWRKHLLNNKNKKK